MGNSSSAEKSIQTNSELIEKVDCATSTEINNTQLKYLTDELHNIEAEATPELVECLKKFKAFLKETSEQYDHLAKEIDAKICTITTKEGKYNFSV